MNDRRRILIYHLWLSGIILSFGFVPGPSLLFTQGRTTSDTYDVKMHAVGRVQRVVSNGPLSPQTYKGVVCQYPPGEGMENMMAGSPVLEMAAAIQDHDSLAYRYTQWWAPGADSRDSIWVVRNFDSVQIPFWASYPGLADEDFVYRCRNDESNEVSVSCGEKSPPVAFSLPPLHVSMLVSNISWSIPPLDDIIVCRYLIIPERDRLTDLFVSLYFRGGIGPASAAGLREADDRSRYLWDTHLALVTDGGFLDGVQSSNCVGYRVFPPRNLAPDKLRWTIKDDFSRQEALQCVKSPAEYAKVMHGLLSSGVYLEGSPPGANWIAVGPFDVPLGDTLEIWTAEILGRGSEDVQDKSAFLDRLFQRGFVTPRPPPAPPLRIERANKSLTLRWDARPGEANPETFRDDRRWDGIDVPFEGYRVYKSTMSLEGPWTLLFECDIAGNGFSRNIGLSHSYTEEGLLNFAEYYYAVTAFSKPDTVLHLPSRESRLQQTRRAAIPGEGPRDRVGEVAAVPNPYRSDLAYNAYDPPWERPSGGWPGWTETDRRIRFINLPGNCVISIYTLAGDLVELLRHTDPDLSFHDWNLTSYVGQAVASGLYLFAVEDRRTGEVQVGKFVVIR